MTGIQQRIIDAMMNQRPPLYSEKKVQVCFIKMDDPEAVNFAGVGVFPNHEGGYLQPPANVAGRESLVNADAVSNA